MNRSGNSLQGLEGGREALERAYLWAVLFDHPGKLALARRLEPCANHCLHVIESSSAERDGPVDDEPCAGSNGKSTLVDIPFGGPPR
jgi:hypothetical protein